MSHYLAISKCKNHKIQAYSLNQLLDGIEMEFAIIQMNTEIKATPNSKDTVTIGFRLEFDLFEVDENHNIPLIDIQEGIQEEIMDSRDYPNNGESKYTIIKNTGE